MAIRRWWLVECDYKYHATEWGNAGQPEGEAAAVISGNVKRYDIPEILSDLGWKLTPRKRICPVCVEAERLESPCPECKHALGCHITMEDGAYCTGVPEYAKEEPCQCRRNP